MQNNVQLFCLFRSAFLRFRIIYAKSINSHRFDLLVVKRTVSEVCLSLSDFVDNIHALDHFAECSIASVKMRSSFVHDEELASA